MLVSVSEALPLCESRRPISSSVHSSDPAMLVTDGGMLQLRARTLPRLVPSNGPKRPVWAAKGLHDCRTSAVTRHSCRNRCLARTRLPGRLARFPATGGALASRRAEARLLLPDPQIRPVGSRRAPGASATIPPTCPFAADNLREGAPVPAGWTAWGSSLRGGREPAPAAAATAAAAADAAAAVGLASAQGPAGSSGRAYLRYSVGTTNMFSSVEVVRPQRMTIAIGV